MSEQTTVRVTVPSTEDNRALGLAIIMHDPELSHAYQSEIANTQTSRHKNKVKYVTSRFSSTAAGADFIEVLPTTIRIKGKSPARALYHLLGAEKLAPKPSENAQTVEKKAPQGPLEEKAGKSYSDHMNEFTRHELDAKLETIEARMDGRVASIEGKIDAFLAAQAVRDAAQTERNQGFDNAIGEIKSGISSMKTTVIVTAISAVLAIVFGIVTFNATLSSNMLAAFQAGKAEAVVIQQAPPGQSAPPPAPTAESAPTPPSE